MQILQNCCPVIADMIDILRKFIRAERTGNWDLYLQALSEMLPFLAASAWAQLR